MPWRGRWHRSRCSATSTRPRSVGRCRNHPCPSRGGRLPRLLREVIRQRQLQLLERRKRVLDATPDLGNDVEGVDVENAQGLELLEGGKCGRAWAARAPPAPSGLGRRLVVGRGLRVRVDGWRQGRGRGVVGAATLHAHAKALQGLDAMKLAVHGPAQLDADVPSGPRKRQQGDEGDEGGAADRKASSEVAFRRVRRRRFLRNLPQLVA